MRFVEISTQQGVVFINPLHVGSIESTPDGCSVKMGSRGRTYDSADTAQAVMSSVLGIEPFSNVTPRHRKLIAALKGQGAMPSKEIAARAGMSLSGQAMRELAHLRRQGIVQLGPNGRGYQLSLYGNKMAEEEETRC